MRALLAAKADPNRSAGYVRYHRSYGPPLLQAVGPHETELVEVLLRAGADPNNLLASGDTHYGTDGSILHRAVTSWGGDLSASAVAARRRACCAMLLCAGASPAVRRRPTPDAGAGGVGDTPLESILAAPDISDDCARLALLLLAFGSPLPRLAQRLARLQLELPAAVALAREYLDTLAGASAEALTATAVAELEPRLTAAATVGASAAVTAAIGGDTDGPGGRLPCPLARLRRVRALVWRNAWRDAPDLTGRTRFSGVFDRLAWARVLKATGEQAEAAAAGRTVPVLRQLSGAPHGSKEREKLLYAAAVCVGSWSDVRQAWRSGELEVAEAEAGIEEAEAQGEETLAMLQAHLPAGGAGAGDQLEELA